MYGVLQYFNYFIACQDKFRFHCKFFCNNIFIAALSASESSDDENFNNNSSVKRVSDSNHISSSSQISKKTKLSRPAKKVICSTIF